MVDHKFSREILWENQIVLYFCTKNMIPRQLLDHLQKRISTSKKVIILYGARQVGKTTLAGLVLEKTGSRVLKINADQKPFMEVLSSRDLDKLKGLTSGYDVLFIDEAQRISDIGINLKILHDNLPELKVFVTGSSSLDLANKLKEPLTGRTWTHHLYPISVAEIREWKSLNAFEMNNSLDEWLRFGLYPEVISFENYEDKREYLNELTTSYLYKDVLALANIRYPEKLRQLLKLLAFQIGNLVSIHELAINLQVNRDTVLNYIDLLEKAFVVFKLGGFSRNLRKEVTSMDKIYFYDLGVRNALIEDFSPINLRQDKGALWENFLLSERKKKLAYARDYANTYFWRTHTGAELDYVEEKDGLLAGFEFKFKKKDKKPPKTWLETYSNSRFQLVHSENFVDFVC